MDNAPIGVVDSGWGGLSIWQSLTKLLPHESLIYIGDHAYLPYSEKSSSFIRRRVSAIVRHLLSRRVKCIVIACNTATVAGIGHYRKQFPTLPIVGVVPVVKVAAHMSKTKRFAVLATPYTAKSSYQQKLIGDYASSCTVYTVACPNLVALVERGEVSGENVGRELSRILLPLAKKGVDVVALGCTHFSFLHSAIRAILGETISIVDSADAVARRVATLLTQKAIGCRKGKPDYRFYTTGDAQHGHRVATELMGIPLRVSYVSI